MAKYLDKNGLEYLWERIKTYIEGYTRDLFLYIKKDIDSQFLVLEGTITGVNAGETKSTSYTVSAINSELGSKGITTTISSMNDIAVISVEQEGLAGDTVIGESYSGIASGMNTYKLSFPSVFIRSNALYIEVLNGSESSGTTSDIGYRIVLLILPK